MRLVQWVAILAMIGPSLATRDPGRSLRQRWWWLDEEKDHEPSKDLPDEDKDLVPSKKLPDKDEQYPSSTSVDSVISVPTSYRATSSSSKKEVPDKDKPTPESSISPVDNGYGSHEDDKSTSYDDKDKSSSSSDHNLSSPTPSAERPTTRTVTDTDLTRQTLTLTQSASSTGPSVAPIKTSSFPDKDESSRLTSEDKISSRTVTDTISTRLTLSLTASTDSQSSSGSTLLSSASNSGTYPTESDMDDQSSSVPVKDQSSRVSSKDRPLSRTSAVNSSTRLTLSLTRSRSSSISDGTPASRKTSGRSQTPTQSDKDDDLPSKDRPSQSTSISKTLTSMPTSFITSSILQGSSGLYSRSSGSQPKIIYTITVQPIPQSTSGLEPTLSGPNLIYSEYETDSSASFGGDSTTASGSNVNSSPNFVSNPEFPALTLGNPSGVSIVPSIPTSNAVGTATTVTFVGYEVVSLSSEKPSATVRPSFTNSTSPVIPVWTPPMLGNAYGGGFIITPSIYVTKAPFSSISEAGVPPGYGDSIVEFLPSSGPKPSLSPEDDSDKPPLSRSDLVKIPTSPQQTEDFVASPSFSKGSSQPMLGPEGLPPETTFPININGYNTKINDKGEVVSQSLSSLSSIVEELPPNTSLRSILSESDASPATSPVEGSNPSVATQSVYPDDKLLYQKGSSTNLPSATMTTPATKDSSKIAVIAGGILSDSASIIYDFQSEETATPAVGNIGNILSEGTALSKPTLQPLVLGDSSPTGKGTDDITEIYTGFETFSEVVSTSSAFTPNPIIPGKVPAETSLHEQPNTGVLPVSSTYVQPVGAGAQVGTSEPLRLISSPTTPSLNVLPSGYNAQQTDAGPQGSNYGGSTESSPDTQPNALGYVALAEDTTLSESEDGSQRTKPGTPSAAVLGDTAFPTNLSDSGSSSDDNLPPTYNDKDAVRGKTPAPGSSGIEAVDVPQETPPGGILSYIEDEFYFPESETPDQGSGAITQVPPIAPQATATSVLTSGLSTSTGGNGSVNNTRSFAFGAVSPLTFDGEGIKLPTVAIQSLMVIILPLAIMCAFL